jgi:hypothetical protein
VNGRGKDGVRKKDRKDFGKGDTSASHFYQDLFCGGKVAVDNDGGRGTFLGAPEVVFVFGEGEVAGLGSVGGGEAFEDGVRVTQDLPGKGFGDFGGGKRHKLLCYIDLTALEDIHFPSIAGTLPPGKRPVNGF